MYLFIMRHGDAQRQFVNDEERELTSLGVEQSLQSGIWLKHVCTDFGFSLDKVLVSPFIRAQQTFQHVAKHIDVVAHETCSDITPSGDPQTAHLYIDALLQQQPSTRSMLLVSHMPFVSYLLDEVCTEQKSLLFSTGFIVAVKYDVDKKSGQFVGQFMPD